MNAKEKTLGDINRIKEIQFGMKILLEDRLKKQIFTEEVKKVEMFSNFNNYYEFWVNGYGDRFFDMGTFIRLASEIEKGLKFYYMEKKGYKNLVDLREKTSLDLSIFQKIGKDKNGNDGKLFEVFKNELNYDLNSNNKLKSMQEFMLIRHLYVHNSGLLDYVFIDKYKSLTGVDISEEQYIKNLGYPTEDVYFFTPLKNMSKYIEDCEQFIKNLP